ncbi:MAG: OmpH family outer membrane protein [Opitutales bacterium]|nr:OmpH family outer membrane protein [Opitutales bacterium]
MKKLFALILALTVTASAFAQQFGIVDFQRASQSYWKVIAEQRSLAEQQQHFAELQQQVKGRIDQLTKDMNAALEDAQNPGLSEERKAEAQALAESKNQEIMQQSQSFQAQYQSVQRRLQLNQATMQSEIMASISKVAKKNNLDMVFYTESAPYGKVDITDEVIADLNSTAPAEAPATAQ